MKTPAIPRRAVLAAPFIAARRGAAAPPRVNVLLITADDLNCSTVGAFGGRVPGVTPNIDRLAASGMRFDRGHVTIAVCQPSRSVLMTGRYPHRNGAEGFQPIRGDVPTLQERLHEAGYVKGILAKNNHLAPREKFHWETYITPEELGQGRSPQLYYRHATEFFRQAKSSGRPFFLMANSQDPHRPFAGSEQELKNFKKHYDFTRQFKPEEAVIPGFLPDIPDVRKEIAQYLTSVYRCDQTVGEVLRALEESGLAGNTLVMFLSDNGMALPFAKTNCYLHSTRTPWIARWPGVTKAGSVNRGDYISGIDYTPTILDAAGLPPIEGVDGRSFVPLLRGASDKARGRLFTVFHETSGKNRYEMRCVQDGRYGYIFNAWADGKTVFKNESQAGLSFNAMRAAAESNAAIAARVEHFLHRAPEELYDFESDPDALRNLAAAPSGKADLERLRREMLAWMERSGDPLLPRLKSRL